METKDADEAMARHLLAEVEATLDELRDELADLGAGRRRSTTSAWLLGVAIGLRLRLAHRRTRDASTRAQISRLETHWRALLVVVAGLDADIAACIR